MCIPKVQRDWPFLRTLYHCALWTCTTRALSEVFLYANNRRNSQALTKKLKEDTGHPNMMRIPRYVLMLSVAREPCIDFFLQIVHGSFCVSLPRSHRIRASLHMMTDLQFNYFSLICVRNSYVRGLVVRR
ncbi:hypothetical protein KP509_32G001700 [Ceratopteris richardii]|uniref:Uncharacterized protein n=1 Tax=Ceratopteris richardii TaxID=49495 RepID=A0A8T2QSJ5_CERRI|nr:hypothetical protein KP509_32G001700 [Ceratopteris richardii]